MAIMSINSNSNIQSFSDIFNPIYYTDGYKISHKEMYPEGTTEIYSNLTPRNTKHFKHSSVWDGKLKVFGLHKAIYSLLYRFKCDFFNYSTFTKEQTKEQKEFSKEIICNTYKSNIERYLNINNFDVSHIEQLIDLGYLPLEIKIIDEQTLVQPGVPVMTIRNTHPDFVWLVGYLETYISCETWKVMTVANIARDFRLLLEHYAEKTGVDKEFVKYQGHDFSMRGLSGIEDAKTCGLAWLSEFNGTDNLVASCMTKTGSTVPATEHSVMCAGGEENEYDTFKRLLKLYPEGIVSIVSDTWDLFGTIDNIIGSDEIKEIIKNRNGKLVIRPDSGNPIDIICGIIPNFTASNDFILKIEIERYVKENFTKDVELVFEKNNKYYKSDVTHNNVYTFAHEPYECTPTSEQKGVLQSLWDIFGGTINEKGYKVLNEKIGIIYGEGMSIQAVEAILVKMEKQGFASSNMVFGVGSYTMQYITRDTLGFAFKATNVVENGISKPIFKNPKTGSFKKSLRGLLSIQEDGSVIENATEEQEKTGLLKTVFIGQ